MGISIVVSPQYSTFVIVERKFAAEDGFENDRKSPIEEWREKK